MIIGRHSVQIARRSAFNAAQSSRYMQHKSSFKSEDSTVETDEVVSSNNPWSPTLYSDKIKVYEPGKWRATTLPSKYRLSYSALYEAPGAKYVAMVKRLTLSFAVIGVYGSKMIWDSPQFDDIYGFLTFFTCAAPAVVTQLKTRDYVTRIFRVYDKEKPQTLENLVNDEKLVVEKLNPTGGKTFNELLTVSGNKNLKLTKTGVLPSILRPYSSWTEKDPVNKTTRDFYVVDDLGGLKMDRIWGIVENNSGVDTGRYMETEIQREITCK